MESNAPPSGSSTLATVLRNTLANWVLPIGLVFLGLSLFQAGRAPEIQVGADGLAPDFVLPSTEGGQTQLIRMRGGPVLLNFWGTWCGPCRREIPALNRFVEAEPGIPLLGLAIDSGTVSALRRAKKRMKIGYPILQANDPVQVAYGIRTVPTTVLIDKDGRVARHHVGAVSTSQLRRWIRDLEP